MEGEVETPLRELAEQGASAIFEVRHLCSPSKCLLDESGAGPMEGVGRPNDARRCGSQVWDRWNSHHTPSNQRGGLRSEAKEDQQFAAR